MLVVSAIYGVWISEWISWRQSYSLISWMLPLVKTSRYVGMGRLNYFDPKLPHLIWAMSWRYLLAQRTTSTELEKHVDQKRGSSYSWVLPLCRTAGSGRCLRHGCLPWYASRHEHGRGSRYRIRRFHRKSMATKCSNVGRCNEWRLWVFQRRGIKVVRRMGLCLCAFPLHPAMYRYRAFYSSGFLPIVTQNIIYFPSSSLRSLLASFWNFSTTSAPYPAPSSIFGGNITSRTPSHYVSQSLLSPLSLHNQPSTNHTAIDIGFAGRR